MTRSADRTWRSLLPCLPVIRAEGELLLIDTKLCSNTPYILTALLHLLYGPHHHILLDSPAMNTDHGSLNMPWLDFMLSILEPYAVDLGAR